MVPRPEDGRFLGWVSRLVHAHRARLTRIARREGVLAEDALDCVQDAFKSFLQLPEARRLVESGDDAAKILAVLVKNHARNRRRRHDRARPHVTDETVVDALASPTPGADEVVARAESYVTMVGCLATLGQIQRAVVDLRLVDDVPGEDVARQLGVTPGHVAVLLHRAKRDLRACYATAPE